MAQKINAHQIKNALGKKHSEDFFMTEVKNGPSFTSNNLLIMDAVAIKKSWTKPCITGYEIKVDRQDFLRDEKYFYYLKYCHKFCFVCPAGLIRPEELDPAIGLIWYNPETGALRTRRAAVYKPLEILPEKLLMYIIMSRTESDRWPFFSNKREFFEEWILDKRRRRELGRYVSNKMTQLIKDAEKRAEKAEYKSNELELKAKSYDKLKELLRANGVPTHSLNWERDLAERLKSGSEEQIQMAVDKIAKQFEYLQKIVGYMREQPEICVDYKELGKYKR